MTPLLEASLIEKSFGDHAVLKRVSLRVAAGEIVSIIGENGAGKSTLAKVIAGIIQPEQGSLRLNGKEVSFPSPMAAIEAGIAIVHQELNLAENLTVIENLMLGREETRFGFIRRGKVSRRAEKILYELAPQIPPDAIVEKLSLAEKQLVEICRALSTEPRLLIFDEPTSSLSEREGDHLLSLIETLKARGMSILYVSHRLAEVQRISDRIVALRDGEFSGGAERGQLSRDQLIHLIIGRELKELYPYEKRTAGNEILAIRDLVATPNHAPASFSVQAGEIVAISGLIGSGRSEILEAIAGMRRPLSGTISISGKTATISSAQDALRAGIALVPESRKEQGLFLDGSIQENIIVSALARESKNFRDQPKERELSDSMIRELSIRCRGREQAVKNLSGGNQQKVVFAKALAATPRVLLLDEPTRGVDIGARRDIYSQLFSLAEEGVAILFVSSELEEVIGIADRAIIVGHGRVQGQLTRDQFSEHSLMTLASASLPRAA